MSDLKVEIDWLGASDSIRTPELRATFARLTIEVGEDAVTLVEDLSNRSVRRSIYVSLYPLAEWIATNWWLLRFDSRGARHLDPDRRHTLLGADDGFLWPDLRIVPEGESCELAWWPDRTSRRAAELRYISRGLVVGRTQQVLEELAGLVGAVLDKLQDAGIQDTSLQKEWPETVELDAEEAEFAEVAARLGLDPFSEGIDVAELIESAFAALDPAVRDDFYDAVRLDSIPETSAWILTNIQDVPDGPPSLHLRDLRTAVLLPSAGLTPPWEVGWDLARQVRSHLGSDEREPFGDLPVAITSRPMLDRQPIVGVGRASADQVGVVATRTLSPASSRFHRARALCHAVLASAETPFLLTNAGTASQRIGRAFAAEVLVPAVGLRRFLEDDFSPDSLSDAADYFQAPLDVVIHQAENQLST